MPFRDVTRTLKISLQGIKKNWLLKVLLFARIAFINATFQKFLDVTVCLCETTNMVCQWNSFQTHGIVWPSDKNEFGHLPIHMFTTVNARSTMLYGKNEYGMSWKMNNKLRDPKYVGISTTRYISAIDSNGLNVADSESFLCIFVSSFYLYYRESESGTSTLVRTPVLSTPTSCPCFRWSTVPVLVASHKSSRVIRWSPCVQSYKCVKYGYSLGAKQ